jgi:hypothetical protein
MSMPLRIAGVGTDHSARALAHGTDTRHKLASTAADQARRRQLECQSLFILRKALSGPGPTLLLIDGERLALNPEGVEVDVTRFEQAVAEALAQRGPRVAGVMLISGGLPVGPVVPDDMRTALFIPTRAAAASLLGWMMTSIVGANSLERRKL